MADSGDEAVFGQCLQILQSSTEKPERFLSVQDRLATDFTSLTKRLYDFHQAALLSGWSGSLLKQLVVENFDEEQIWQELELQNTAALPHFEKRVSEAITDPVSLIDDEEEEEDEDEDEEEEEEEESGESDAEQKKNEEDEESRVKPGLSESEEDEDELQDEDIDFDVDELERRSKRPDPGNRKEVKSGAVSEVDDRFFKLAEMEAFLDDMDKMEGKPRASEDIDYFQDVPSDDDDHMTFDKPASTRSRTKKKSSRNVKYRDYFTNDDEPQEQDDEDEEEEDVDSEVSDLENQKGGSAHRKVTFDLDSEGDSEGEDVEEVLGGKSKSTSATKPDTKSTFEKRQEKMGQKISELENAALAKKPWQLSGEVTAQTRPENSMLEEDVDFEQASRLAPAVTEESTMQLEDLIKQRIKDQAWDDVVRKEKPKEDVLEYKKRLTLEHEKSKLSLAEVYEQEFIKQTQDKKEEEEENPAHVEIQTLMDALFIKLDALSNFHFTPKPHVPEVKIVSNLPTIMMEEVAPVSSSMATLLAPEEVKEKNKAGDLLGVSEKTDTDKKRERRKKKKLKRLKIQEKEKKRKLREAADDGKMKKKSRAQVEETLKKLTKGGQGKVLTDDGMDKALRSSQAFFSQLQDQVRSQIKGSKAQGSKKKKTKVASVGALKL